MTYKKLSNHSLHVLGFVGLALSLVGLGCGDSSSTEGAGGTGGSGGIVQGCFAPIAPVQEPDLILPPVFAGEIVVPGTVIEGDVRVDGETRIVIVELANYWDLDKPASGMEQMQTGGNQTLSFAFPTDAIYRGRYFFRITLCAEDCASSRIMFTLASDPDDPDLRSRYYQRIVFEGDTEVRSDTTCVDADSIVVQ